MKKSYKKKIGKKGEISTSFLISMILLILGFLILLLFIFNFGGNEQADRQACHASVIFRATLPGLLKDYVGLKCQTRKICISSGFLKDTFRKANCTEFQGETGITTVKVKNLDQIEKLYAQEIVDCWEMMGEGKVSLFYDFSTTSGFGSVYPSCTICSRIAYDSYALNKLGINADDINIEEYMRTHQMSGKNMTYFEYVAGKGGKYSAVEVDPTKSSDSTVRTNEVKQIFANDAGTAATSSGLIGATEFKASTENLDLKKQGTAVLFMQISSPTQKQAFQSWVNANLAILGLSARYAPGSIFTTPMLKYTAASSTFSSGPMVWGSENTLVNPTFYQKTPAKLGFTGKFGLGPLATAYAAISVSLGLIGQTDTAWMRSVTAGYCGDISTGTTARDGCSVVRAIPYSAKDISSYCSVIESIP